jgi:HD-GYP domain-containing protein (c-di-GMP phosphodiesterase class II)
MENKLFEKISLNAIESGAIPFDLFYIKNDQQYSLLCKKGQTVNERHLGLVRTSGNDAFIRATERDTFIDYAEKRLTNKIIDQRISLREKSRMVHMFSSRAIRAAIADPKSEKALNDTRRAAQYLRELIFEEPKAPAELFAHTESEAYSYSHPQNVALLNLLIGKKLLMNHVQKMEELALCGFWFDIGKTQIRKEILQKRETFTADEMEEVERHVFYSEQIIRGHSMEEEICQAGRNHHERWDGKGYPDGLDNKLIPLYARITAVTDAYDAITSTRIHKEADSQWLALSKMARSRGAFDPKILTTLVKVVLRHDQLINEFRAKHGLVTIKVGAEGLTKGSRQSGFVQASSR